MSAGQRLYNAHIAGTDNKAVAGATLDLSPIAYAGLLMPASGVTPGVYGHSTLTAQLTIDASGRVTSATEVSVAGGGTVTSFSSGNLSPIFTSSVATDTTTPALTFALSNQDTKKVLIGPASGAAAAPTFRLLAVSDIPAGLPYLASVALTMPAVFAVTGSPLTADGTLAVSWSTNSVQNKVLASPDGSTGAIALRSFVLADLPTQANNTILGNISGGAAVPSALSGSNVRTICGLATTDTPQFAGLGINTAADATRGVTIKKDGVDDLSSTPRSVLFAGGGTVNKGFYMGYDTAEQLGVIVSQGASSGLSFWSHNGSAWGERFRVHTDGTFIVNGATRIGPAGAGSAQPLEIVGTDGGLAVTSTNTGLGKESYVAGFMRDAGSTYRKLGAVAWQWADDNATTGYASWNVHTTKLTGGVGADFFGLTVWADNGAAFFPSDLTAASAPGQGVLKINGYLTVVGAAASPSTNGTASIGASATYGNMVIGKGSSNDVTLFNRAGSIALGIPTGTVNTVLGGSITTDAPSGGIAAAWKLGVHGVGSVEADVASSLYHLVTTEGIFGGLYIHDGTTAQSITNGFGTTYTQLTGFNTAQGHAGLSSNCTPSTANSKITVGKVGKYFVAWAVSGTAGTANLKWACAAFAAGAEVEPSHGGTKMLTNTDLEEMSGCGFVSITSLAGAGGDIDLRMTQDGGAAANFTPVFVNLTVQRVGD